MPRLSNARTIADIEFVLETSSLAPDASAWQSYGVDCTRDRHRFSNPGYAFIIDVLHLRSSGIPGRSKWYAVILTEQWRFTEGSKENRTTKSLKVIHGKQADILSWMRKSRESKLTSKKD